MKSQYRSTDSSISMAAVMLPGCLTSRNLVIRNVPVLLAHRDGSTHSERHSNKAEGWNLSVCFCVTMDQIGSDWLPNTAFLQDSMPVLTFPSSNGFRTNRSSLPLHSQHTSGSFRDALKKTCQNFSRFESSFKVNKKCSSTEITPFWIRLKYFSITSSPY